MRVPDYVRRLLWEYPGHFLDPRDPRSHRVYFAKVFIYGELEAWWWAFQTFGREWIREHSRRRPQALPVDSRRLLALLLGEPKVQAPLDGLTPFPDIPRARKAECIFKPPFALPGLVPVSSNETGGAGMKRRVPFEVSAPPRPESFYLVGGAALALHLAHRETEGLGFFTSVEGFVDADWEGLGFRVLSRKQGTVELLWQDVPVSLFYYPYPLLEPAVETRGFRVAGLSDLAAMKLVAVTQRGARKDFVLLKALAYFEEAVAEPEVETNPPLSWKKVKRQITAALKTVV